MIPLLTALSAICHHSYSAVRLRLISTRFAMIKNIVAALFALSVDTLAITQSNTLVMLAPVGGFAMLFGWLALAFTKPNT